MTTLRTMRMWEPNRTCWWVPSKEQGAYRRRRTSTVVYLATARRARSQVIKRTKGPLFDHDFKVPVSDGTKEVLIKLKDKGVLSTKLIGECAVPMVEVAAHGDIGLQRWFRLVGAGGSVGGEERGQVEVSLSWVYDRKYARSAARLLAGAADVLAAAGNVFARKKQEPRIDDEDKPQDEDAWMLEDTEDMVPLKLTSKEQEEVNERLGMRA